MDFSLDAEQQLLEKTARSVAQSQAGRFPRLLPEHVSAPDPSDERLEAIEECWSELVQLGFTGLLVPEVLGGSGGTLVDAVIVAEALAYSLVPVPFAGNAIIAATLLKRSRTDAGDAVLRRLAVGGRACVALSADLTWPATGDATIAWDWLPGDEALVDTGTGLRSVRTGTGVGCADPLRRLGSLVDAAHGHRRSTPAPVVHAFARIACAAQLAGLARRAVDVAAEHARNREQFGSPIGAFQAVQLLLADCYVASEAARSALLGAAWAAGSDDRAAPRAGAAAFAVCAEAGLDASLNAMQVLGGVGATWESEVHLLLRPARLLASAFGGLPAAYELLADELLAA